MKIKSTDSSIWNTFLKHPFKTVSCLTAGLLVACGFLYFVPNVYESSVSIEHPKPNQEHPLRKPFGTSKTAATAEITSTGFIAEALEGKIDPVYYYIEQDFQKRFDAYSFPYTVKYHPLNAKFREQEYTIEAVNEETYKISSTIKGVSRSKIGDFGKELIDQDLEITITRKKIVPFLDHGLLKSPTYSFKIQSPEALADALLSKDKCIAATEEQGVITITCRNESPALAKQIATALADRYLLGKSIASSNSGPATPTKIDSQLAELSMQLEATEIQIAEYKRQNNITEINFDTENALALLTNLQLRKSQLQMNLAALNNTSDYLRKNREINNSNVDYGTINDPIFSEQIANLNSKYKAKESGTSPTSTDSEIEDLKTTIAERILNTRKKTTIQINRMNQEIAAIQMQLSTLPEKANTLNSLGRQLALDKKVYDLLAEQRAQLLVSGTGHAAIGRVLSAASNPVPVFPIAGVIIALGLFAGLLISIPMNLIAEKLQSRKVTNRAEINQQSTIPFIGTIAEKSGSAENMEQSISTLCMRVLLQENKKMITFASTNRGEGKTFIATHFALALAALDKKVLVIDMNSDRAAVADFFQVNPDRSLADVLKGACDIHDAITISSYPNLDVLECGKSSAGANNLLASNKRAAIIESLRKHYDIIVTDTPDIGTRIDAIPMMKMSDLTLFVVKPAASNKQSLIAAEQAIEDYNLENLFVLLNAVRHTNKPLSASDNGNKQDGINEPAEQPVASFIPEMMRKIAMWFY